jgi:hypothetical protein
VIDSATVARGHWLLLLSLNLPDQAKYGNRSPAWTGSKIGLDATLEALRESIRSHQATADDLWQAAKVCRVANMMKPYIEALL